MGYRCIEEIQASFWHIDFYFLQWRFLLPSVPGADLGYAVTLYLLAFWFLLRALQTCSDVSLSLSLPSDISKKGLEFLSGSLGSTHVRIIGDACEFFLFHPSCWESESLGVGPRNMLFSTLPDYLHAQWGLKIIQSPKVTSWVAEPSFRLVPDE